MSAITKSPVGEPQVFFVKKYLGDIESRSRRHFAQLGADAVEEAVQDCAAFAWQMFVAATAKGKVVENNTPSGKKGMATSCSLAWYANRLYDSGRRFGGSSATDAMGDGTRSAGRSNIISFDHEVQKETALHEQLACSRLDNRPDEQCRVDHDYPYIMENSDLSANAQRIWRELLLDHTPGHVTRIAKKMKRSPGRVCQGKRELADALESWGYTGPVCKRKGKSRGRPRGVAKR